MLDCLAALAETCGLELPLAAGKEMCRRLRCLVPHHVQRFFDSLDEDLRLKDRRLSFRLGVCSRIGGAPGMAGISSPSRGARDRRVHDVMAPPTRRFNPGFLTDDELVASYCVRTTEFDLLVEVLRECTGHSNAHQIVIGARGSGKTSLLLRVAAEARRDTALSTRCFPVTFAEESYEVGTAGEFWLECLANLAAQAPRGDDAPELDRTVEELRAIRDDQILSDRCLGALLDFADREGKRLVLLVENLNMLFGDMADPDAGWRLRKVLQTEPRIIVFASATSRFDEIDTRTAPCTTSSGSARCAPSTPDNAPSCGKRFPAAPQRRRPFVRWRFSPAEPSPDLHRSRLRGRIVVPRPDGPSARSRRRPHGVLQGAPRIAAAPGTACLSRARRAVEAGDHAGDRGPGPARNQHVQRPACAPRRARGGSSCRRQRKTQAVLPDRAPVQHLLPAAAPAWAGTGSWRGSSTSWRRATRRPELKNISDGMVRDAVGLGAEMRSLHWSVLEGLMESPRLAAYRDELSKIVPADFAAVSGRNATPVEVETTAEMAMEIDRAEPSQGGTGEGSAETAARELFTKRSECSERCGRCGGGLRGGSRLLWRE